ncbi:MAG: hypothetical protein GY739_19190 [Mesoflavibacter sp.]|nr:hypothetical protein [Mesoflavibacter sp.]
MLDLEKKLKKLQGKTIKVGVPASTAPYENGISTAVIAAVHEYGSLTRNVPARPFLRPGVANAIPKINKLLQIKLPDFVEGSINADGVFTLVGEIARSEIVRMWDNNNWSPLKSKSAQKAVEKGNRQILLDTGHLKNSITYQVI